MRRSGRFKKFLVNAGLVLGSIIICLAGAELWLRLTRPQYEYAAKSAAVRHHSRLWENPRSYCYWRRHPDTDQNLLVIHNSLGFRQHREFSARKEKGTIRIGFFGDSYTANLRIESQYSFTEPLDYLLNKTGRRFEVMNFGVDAYGTEQIYLQYLQDGTLLNLDMVFYVFCFNDLADIHKTDLLATGPGGEIRSKLRPKTRLLTRLASRLYLTSLYLEARPFVAQAKAQLGRFEHGEELKEKGLGGAKRHDYQEVSNDFSKNIIGPKAEETLAWFFTLVKEMDHVAASRGASFYVVTLPKNQESNLDRFLEEQGVDYLSLADGFRQNFSREDYTFERDPHWNEEGNKLTAIMLFDFIIKQAGMENPGQEFIEQALYEYYSAFGFRLVSTRFTQKHNDLAEDAQPAIVNKYLSLEGEAKDCPRQDD